MWPFEENSNSLDDLTAPKESSSDDVETKVNDPWLRRYIASVTATTSFFTPLSGINEYFIAGMEGDEVLQTRLISAGVNFFYGGIYGWFRGKWANFWNTDANSSRLRKLIVDTTGNVTLGVPTYIGILASSGASAKEIAATLPGLFTLVIVTGRPFGWYMDKVKKLFGVKPTLDHYVENEKENINYD